MIWLKRALGEPFELNLATVASLDGVEIAAAARGPDGSLWPMTAVVINAAAGTYRIDGRGAGRVWPAGVLWLDIRLTRGPVVVHSDTFGIVVLDATGAAEDARRAAALAPFVGQRRVWTLEGEVLDALCLRELGSEHLAALVLDINPGLAAFGPILPAGVGVILPEAARRETTAPTVRLWGRA